MTKEGVDTLPDVINSIPKVSSTRLEQLFINAGDTQRLIALDILCPRLNILDLPNIDQIDQTNENVLQIIWIVLDKPVTKDILNIATAEDLASLLNMATLFESEYGDVSCGVILSIMHVPILTRVDIPHLRGCCLPPPLHGCTMYL